MTDTQNLIKKDAINKLQKLVNDTKSCVFLTNLATVPLEARPMYTKDVDDRGNLWFILTQQGEHFKSIQDDKRIQLFYANPGKAEFLSIYGEAEVIKDEKKKNELWSDMDKAYFDGPEDDDIAVAKVKPSSAYYWDTKSGRAETLIKMASAAVGGNKKDIGVKGTLDV